MPRKSSQTEPVAAAPPPPATLPASGSTPRGRPSWSGILRFSLVAVPVKAYPATSSNDAIHFHQLHADCGQRIAYEKRCPLHGAVEASQIVKGYQYASGQYVILQAEELESLRSARDKALSLERFVDPGQIDPVVFSGRCLYLLPESGPAQRPYLLLAQALRARNRWGLGRVVLSGHRHAVVLRPLGRLLAMDVLHEPSRVRSAAWLEEELQQVDASPEELQLAEMLIHTASGPLDWQPFRDDTADKLATLVAAKVAGQQIVSPVEEPFSVLPLLDALKQSVARTQNASATTDPSATAQPAGPAKRRRSA